MVNTVLFILPFVSTLVLDVSRWQCTWDGIILMDIDVVDTFMGKSFL